MKNIAIITARGGSKRIPRKNIKSFCGKPIIAYSIEAAIKSGIFDEVMVSTDDEEIASIAKNFGANVPFFRSEATSSDYATTCDVLLEVIEEYRKRGKCFEYMACIYPTAPFITDEKLKKAFEMITDRQGESVEPVVTYSFPPQRCYVMNEEGFIKYNFPEYADARSQDLCEWYHDAGQFYIYEVDSYIKKNGKITKMLPIIVSELEVQDIDNETDWKLAEMKYKMMEECRQ